MRRNIAALIATALVCSLPAAAFGMGYGDPNYGNYGRGSQMMYYCNGYYSYSPCQQTSYHYPSSYYYPSNSYPTYYYTYPTYSYDYCWYSCYDTYYYDDYWYGGYDYGNYNYNYNYNYNGWYW